MKLTLSSLALAVLMAASAIGAEQWAVLETSFTSAKEYESPFVDVEVDVVFRSGDLQWLVPAFWAGDDQWTVRFAPPVQGDYTFQVKCSDPTNKGLNGSEQSLPVTAYTGDNLLLKHGFLRVSTNKRHFEHADGTPFFWLGDTWWKCLCKEGHMQQGFGDVQRRMFWGRILSGAAGHTYGAAGIWHASVEGDPGCASAAFGGTKVYDVTYQVFYFDPATGRRLDQGTVTYAGPTAPPFKRHTKPLLLVGRFAVSATPFDPPPGSIEAGLPGVIRTDEYHAPDLPSPQDWVLVLERFKP